MTKRARIQIAGLLEKIELSETKAEIITYIDLIRKELITA